MYEFTRDELQLYWKAAQRRRGRMIAQSATAFRVGMHASTSVYKSYIKGLTDKLEKALDGELKGQDEVEAFFATLPNAQRRKTGADHGR